MKAQIAWRVAVVMIVCAELLWLTGCRPASPPPPAIVHVPLPAPVVPGECDNANDPRWRDLADDDARRDAVINNIAANKRTTRTLAQRRAICGAALREHGMIAR